MLTSSRSDPGCFIVKVSELTVAVMAHETDLKQLPAHIIRKLLAPCLFQVLQITGLAFLPKILLDDITADVEDLWSVETPLHRTSQGASRDDDHVPKLLLDLSAR